jgi:short-subunit dehydrogenase involved in D-alanine esterification of teichoic acids
MKLTNERVLIANGTSGILLIDKAAHHSQHLVIITGQSWK